MLVINSVLEQEILEKQETFNNNIQWFIKYVAYLNKNIAPSHLNKYQSPVLSIQLQNKILDFLHDNFNIYGKNYNANFWINIDGALRSLSRRHVIDQLLTDKLCHLLLEFSNSKKTKQFKFIIPLLKNNNINESVLLKTIENSNKYKLLKYMAGRKTLSTELETTIMKHGDVATLCTLTNNTTFTDMAIIFTLLNHKSNSVRRNIFKHYDIPLSLMAEYYINNNKKNNMANKIVGDKLINSETGKEIGSSLAFIGLVHNKKINIVKNMIKQKIAEKILE